MAPSTARRITFASKILLQKKLLLLTSTAPFAFPCEKDHQYHQTHSQSDSKAFTALTGSGKHSSVPGWDRAMHLVLALKM